MTRPVLMLTSGGLEHGGGIGRMIGYLLEECRRSGFPWQFTILDTRGPGALKLWPVYFTRTVLGILTAMPRRPILHIHIAGRGSTLRKVFLVILGRMLRLPVILHLHDYDYEAFCRSLPKPLVSVIRWTFQRARYVIVLGETAQKMTIGYLRVVPDRVRVLPNAVPAPPDTSDTPERAAGRATDVKILFLGQLSRRKGVHDLIAALDHPRLRSLDWTATLAGGGPQSEIFGALVTATSVAGKIDLPGWLDRTATTALLRDADILVLPSYAEGLAMSVLEGMAYGLCVICTPVGAMPEAITHDQDGLMVQAGAVEELAYALATCVQSPDLRHRLGAGAAARFARDFDVRRYPERLAAVYRDIDATMPC